MKNYIINYIREGETPFLKKTKKILHRIQDKRIETRHSLAQKFPKIIKADIETVSIALTSKCNLKCKGCSYGRDFMPSEQLSLEKVKEILRSTKALNIQYVWFYGGEPSMVKSSDLLKIVAYATELGLTSTLGTNGVMLDAKLMSQLYKVGLRRVAIGLYGINEAYEQYVDRENVFEKLENNIANIKENYPNVSISVGWLLMKPTCNLDALEELVSFSKRHHLRFSINLVHYDFPYFVTEAEEKTLLLNEEDLPAILEVKEALIKLKKSHPELVQDSFTGLNSLDEWLLKKEKIEIPCYRYDYLWIAPNGEVRVCQKADLLGNVLEKPLEEILYNKRHHQSARDCFALHCTGCNVDWDRRTTSTPKSRKKFKITT